MHYWQVKLITIADDHLPGMTGTIAVEIGSWSCELPPVDLSGNQPAPVQPEGVSERVQRPAAARLEQRIRDPVF